MNVFGSRDVSAFRLDDNLGSYMRQIRTFPMLAFDEEQRLARRWVEHRYIDAAHKLVTSRMLGAFRDDAMTRREFLAMIGGGQGHHLG